MAKILLDYVFPISVITPTSQASTAFLKNVAVVAKPKVGVSAGVTLCTTMTAVAALTNNTNAQKLFDAGMSRVYVVVNSTLDIATLLESHAGDFYTILIADDFVDADLEDLDVGDFECVIGVSTQDGAVATEQAAIENRVAFISGSTPKAKNMFYAFGKLLSNASNWLNQQYISMPENDSITELGDAETYFDDRVSFVLRDDEYLNRLGLFAAGGKAIVAPYILKNLRIDMQSAALSWISSNQPQYTVKEAALLEARLVEDVINLYIARKWITAGTLEITLEQENFVATGAINVSEPKALWRVFSEMRQTL